MDGGGNRLVAQNRTNPVKTGQRDASLFPENQANSFTGPSTFSRNRSDPVKSGHGVVEGGELRVEGGEVFLGADITGHFRTRDGRGSPLRSQASTFWRTRLPENAPPRSGNAATDHPPVHIHGERGYGPLAERGAEVYIVLTRHSDSSGAI